MRKKERVSGATSIRVVIEDMGGQHPAGQLAPGWLIAKPSVRATNVTYVDFHRELLGENAAGVSSQRKSTAFEDMLDAVICAWVGICVFEGTAVPFGNDTSAIWIPRSELLALRREQS